jgi:hypothetical protein
MLSWSIHDPEAVTVSDDGATAEHRRDGPDGCACALLMTHGRHRLTLRVDRSDRGRGFMYLGVLAADERTVGWTKPRWTPPELPHGASATVGCARRAFSNCQRLFLAALRSRNGPCSGRPPQGGCVLSTAICTRPNIRAAVRGAPAQRRATVGAPRWRAHGGTARARGAMMTRARASPSRGAQGARARAS